MARPKRTTLICMTQVACDGASMMGTRKMCYLCEDKIKKRSEVPPKGIPGIQRRPRAKEVT